MPPLKRMTLEHTDSGHIKATHQFKDGLEPEIHAISQPSLNDHLSAFFGLKSPDEKSASAAKQRGVKSYEKVHGSLIPPVSTPVEPAAPVKNKYDKIRDEIRVKLSKPPDSVPSLLARANALLKSPK